MKNHPLEVFKYCPKCGSELFEVHNAKSKHCSNCGFTYYQNPSSATAAFILNSDGELLVVQRGKEPAKGTLDLPGGFVDNDESSARLKRRPDSTSKRWSICSLSPISIATRAWTSTHSICSTSVMLAKGQRFRLLTMQLLAAGFPCDRCMWSVSDSVRYVKACIVS